MNIASRDYKTVWCVDFEFAAIDGNAVKVICMVAKDLVTGQTIRMWQDDLEVLNAPPFSIDGDSLFVAYFASAEMGCFKVLGWAMPANTLDLFTEFRNCTNGLPVPSGNGLLGALVYHGLNSLKSLQKESMRKLALRDGPWTPTEKSDLLDYCESDVDALARLLPKMVGSIDLERALLRGRYMQSVAAMENIGIPLDEVILGELRGKWTNLQDILISKIDENYGVYEGRTFKRDKFANWLAARGIPWPRLESGQLDLKDDTFKAMVQTYPTLQPLRELRVSLSQMKLNDLSVGSDGRNRCLISPFRSITGRNQPSTSKFIFGNPSWLRGLINPQPGFGIAYIDWSQQEFGIAAALSVDPLMMKAYESGDPYLAFAKQAGAVPDNATKESHKAERDLFKACVLAVQYGMGAESLALSINQPTHQAKHLLNLHHETYKQFWKWSDSVVDHAMLYGQLWTVFGWTIRVGQNPNPRSLRNFPMQANGAEMLRLAIVKVIEAGIRVCAPVHDAILIEAPLNELVDTIAMTQELMAEASAIILDGFRLRTDVDEIRYPDRYMDPRGQQMWDTVMGLLNE